MAPGLWNSEHDKNLLLLLVGLDIEVPRARFDEIASQMSIDVSGNACRYVSLSIISISFLVSVAVCLIEQYIWKAFCICTARVLVACPWAMKALSHGHLQVFPNGWHAVGGAGGRAPSSDPGSYEDRTTQLEGVNITIVSNSHMNSPTSLKSGETSVESVRFRIVPSNHRPSSTQKAEKSVCLWPVL